MTEPSVIVDEMEPEKKKMIQDLLFNGMPPAIIAQDKEMDVTEEVVMMIQNEN